MRAYGAGWWSFWNFSDLLSYVLQIAIAVLHLQCDYVDEGYFSVLVATQHVLMWSKLHYFARTFPAKSFFLDTIRAGAVLVLCVVWWGLMWRPLCVCACVRVCACSHHPRSSPPLLLLLQQQPPNACLRTRPALPQPQPKPQPTRNTQTPQNITKTKQNSDRGHALVPRLPDDHAARLWLCLLRPVPPGPRPLPRLCQPVALAGASIVTVQCTPLGVVRGRGLAFFGGALNSPAAAATKTTPLPLSTHTHALSKATMFSFLLAMFDYNVSDAVVGGGGGAAVGA